MFITLVCVVAFHASWCADFSPELCRWFRMGVSDDSLIQKGVSVTSPNSEGGSAMFMVQRGTIGEWTKSVTCL